MSPAYSVYTFLILKRNKAVLRGSVSPAFSFRAICFKKQMSWKWQLVLLKFTLYIGRCRSNYWLVSLSVHQTALMPQESHQRQGNYRTRGARAKHNVYNNITKLGCTKSLLPSDSVRHFAGSVLWNNWSSSSHIPFYETVNELMLQYRMRFYLKVRVKSGNEIIRTQKVRTYISGLKECKHKKYILTQLYNTKKKNIKWLTSSSMRKTSVCACLHGASPSFHYGL